MLKQLRCMRCGTVMKVAYIREGKTWKRVAWACARCYNVEPGLMNEFRPHRKSRIK